MLPVVEPQDEDKLRRVVGGISQAEFRSGSVMGGSYGEVRNIIQIPFDDSVDSTHPLECFFQMPLNTAKIYSAKIWVQRKSFRQYVQAASSSSSSGGSAHTHNQNGFDTTTTDVDGGGGASPSSSGGRAGQHSHTDPQGGSTGLDTADHTHTIGHGHTVHHHNYLDAVNSVTSNDNPAHTHTITTSTSLNPGIFETAASGTLSLFVADDGVTYGAAVVSGLTAISGTDIASLLSLTPGDRRIRIDGTGLTRVQVLLVLDLLVGGL